MPRKRDVMALEHVRVAADTKRRWDEKYRDAVVAAREAGHTFTEIADAAGISRQAARKIGRNT